MLLPVILAVDDDRAALDGVTAQLAQRYVHDYRIESSSDPDDALGRLQQLAESGEDVALVLAGSSLAPTSGGHLLENVRQLHPHAGRALVVSPTVWADEPTADAIRDAMTLGRIDYYVPRPSGRLDEVFHEAISGFLLEWARDRKVVPQTVQIVGEEWSGRAFELREVFEQCAAPHSFCLADSDKGRELLAQVGPEARLPLMVMPDGKFLSDPSDAEIAEVVGAPPGLEEQEFDVIIVGAGPAGLSAAVYGASEGLSVLTIDAGGIGGQARSSSLIRNYLGFPMGVSGSRLAEQAHAQAVAFGAQFLFMHRAVGLTTTDHGHAVTLEDGRRVAARVVILATGATYRRLGVPALEELRGAGVFYGGSASEAPALKGKDAFIAGGGNSAGQAALHLARHARQVTLVVRGSSLDAGMSHYLVQTIEATPNIVVRTGTTVVDGGGAGRLERLVLRGPGGDETVAADALFALIGARPRIDWLPVEIARDPHGFLLTGANVAPGDWPLERAPLSHETSMPGVLAIGDVCHGSVKRVASAVGAGAIAVQLVHRLLDDAATFPPAGAGVSGLGA